MSPFITQQCEDLPGCFASAPESRVARAHRAYVLLDARLCCTETRVLCGKHQGLCRLKQLLEHSQLSEARLAVYSSLSRCLFYHTIQFPEVLQVSSNSALTCSTLHNRSSFTAIPYLAGRNSPRPTDRIKYALEAFERDPDLSGACGTVALQLAA